jgi:hypothetical protein
MKSWEGGNVPIPIPIVKEKEPIVKEPMVKEPMVKEPMVKEPMVKEIID